MSAQLPYAKPGPIALTLPVKVVMPFEGGIRKEEKQCPGFMRAHGLRRLANMHQQQKSLTASGKKEIFWAGLRS
jgi:hypothetical protein